jgi:hypothetical protein
LIDGIRQAYADDHEALKAGMQMFESLSRAFDVMPPAGSAAANAGRRRSTTHRKRR